MYDPMTVAFEVKRPWPTPPTPGSKWRYFPPILTIWHVDPEMDGTDDSCGWFSKTEPGDQEWCESIAAAEFDFTFGKHGEVGLFRAGAVEIMFWAWCLVKTFRKHGKDKVTRSKWERPSHRETAMILDLLSCPGDNFQWAISRARESVEGLTELLSLVLRYQRRVSRPWYRHPRWHIHHWKLQVHPLQDLKRWLFSRCAGCGGRFIWGYAPVSGQWHGTGPLWFKSEERVFHHDCSGNCVVGVGSDKPANITAEEVSNV